MYQLKFRSYTFKLNGNIDEKRFQQIKTNKWNDHNLLMRHDITVLTVNRIKVCIFLCKVVGHNHKTSCFNIQGRIQRFFGQTVLTRGWGGLSI